MRWTEVSENPNSKEALQYRASQLVEAHGSPVDYRDPYLAELARGKRVLDVGVVNHLSEGDAHAAYLHRALVQVASECVGIDIVEKGVASLSEQGYDVHVADISVPGLAEIVGTAFDLVIAGELIEHIDSPGVMLENAESVLVKGGRLILTTPNPYGISSILSHARGRVEENVDHLMFYFPSGMAELADRYGWKLVKYRGSLDARSPRSLKRKALKMMTKFTTEDFPCWTYIYELEAP